MEIKKLECMKCGHHWLPRAGDPVMCPRCKSYYWNGFPKDFKLKKEEFKNKKFKIINTKEVN